MERQRRRRILDNVSYDQALVELHDLLKILVEPLIEHKDEIKIVPVEKEHQLVLQLYVNNDDMGRVIGRAGKRAQAIRTLIKAKASRVGVRVAVDIVDNFA